MANGMGAKIDEALRVGDDFVVPCGRPGFANG